MLAGDRNKTEREDNAGEMLLDPELLLLDEPISAFDQEAATRVEELLVELKVQTTLLLVSHCQIQVQRIADQIYEVKGCRLHAVPC